MGAGYIAPDLREQRGPRGAELRLLITGLVASVLIHAAVGFGFSRIHESFVAVEGHIERGPVLCAEGRRCQATGWHRPRLGIEAAPAPEMDIIQAAVIPRLGMLEQDPKKLPELQKYEQPEKVEDGVNLEEDNPKPKEPLRFKEFKPKKAQRDRRSKRRRSLDAILGAPDDDDPRRRAVDLAKIIGRPKGSVYGRGSEFAEGNEWAGRVQLAMRKLFHVPASIDSKKLKRLSVEVTIRKLSPRGAIERFDVTRRSGDDAYNTAAVQLIKQFVPSEGGTSLLPAPSKKVLDYVNRNGMVVELDGRLFRR